MEGGGQREVKLVAFPLSLRPTGSVEMSCCCFSGTKSDGECGEGVSATASERICHCSARLQALADGQASLTDQCCRRVAVLSMTKPGIPSLGLARSSNCRCLQGSVRWLK